MLRAIVTEVSDSPSGEKAKALIGPDMPRK
jgi:hypothetical protein